MEILCKFCGQWFIPSDDSIDLISEGFISSDSVNTCDDCWDLIQLSEFDYYEMHSDLDPGL